MWAPKNPDFVITGFLGVCHLCPAFKKDRTGGTAMSHGPPCLEHNHRNIEEVINIGDTFDFGASGAGGATTCVGGGR